jgi:Cd2+/Zn2+-exporting ATPase
MLIRIIISGLLLIFGIVFATPAAVNFCILLTAFVIIGYEVVFHAVKNIAKFNAFDESFLMTVASVGAFCIGEYPEAVAVMLFYNIGEFFAENAEEKSRKSITKLLDLRPDYANICIDGEIQQVSPENVAVGSTIIVKTGERVPIDGVVSKGNCSLDNSSLTGESLPVDVKNGDKILSGSVNLNGVIEIITTEDFKNSTISRILEITQNEQAKKTNTEKFITKFAKIYTPVVVISAILLAIIGGFITGNYSNWVYRGLEFLVVSCPCALVISVPLSYFAGIGACSKAGVLVKGGIVLDNLATVKNIAFDKTGTLTTGKLTFTNSGNFTEKQLQLIASLEILSSHPVAKAVCQAYNGEILQVESYTETAGMGVSGNVDNYFVEIKRGVVSINGEKIGNIEIESVLKDNTKNAVKSLKNYNCFIISGDSESACKKIGDELGLKYFAECSPLQKAELLKTSTLYLGDGINDAPALSAALVGIAMGGIGSDVAIEAADAVIMNDDLESLGKLFKISKKVRHIVLENIYFAIGIKITVLVLAALGIANIWLAVFADVGVTFLAVLNSLRTLGK